ncbi:MAG: carboxypeptidase-like regulatory domain-containing protein [Prolixibacteraceae bacterium]|nr:carboxypeptidase-like regulatory domain-containing protein [Prolixibacteraceae bacterium]
MEAFGKYLLQMACWLAGFGIVYYILLRKETHYNINRWFLVSGLFVSLVFPLFPLQYKVVKPFPNIPLEVVANTETVESGFRFNLSLSEILMMIYIAGITFFVLRFILQILKLKRLKASSKHILISNTNVYQVEKETAPFSFFRNIYVSKTMDDSTVLETVVAHEKVHIEEHHWADLLLFELARSIQWFNPLMHLYRKAIMQNHEYLADLGALGNGIQARNYQTILINQMFGIPVLQMVSSFTMFNPGKRITMMKKNKSKPAKKLKVLWAVPLIAIILFAFAEPKYEYSGTSTLPAGQNTISVKGIVIDADGEPLPGTSVIVSKTTTGTITDLNGNFILEGIDPDALIVFSFVGYETVKLKADKKMKVKMKKQVYKINPSLNVVETNVAPPPPPPPPKIIDIKGKDGKEPLIVVDGKIYNGDISEIDPVTIKTISVLKEEIDTKAYGAKGKNGVIEITTKSKEFFEKKEIQEEEVFIVVEDMPQFNGGDKALQEYLIKATTNAKEKGSALIGFTVLNDGSIDNVRIKEGTSDYTKKAAYKIVSSMPKWKPGMQRGKPVKVDMEIQIDF